MIDLDIEVDTRDAELFVRGVSTKAIGKAEVRTLNKLIVTVRKEAVQLIHRRRRLKKTDIRKAMTLIRANKRVAAASIRLSKRPISLKRYAAKWTGRKGNRRVVINVDGQRQRLNHAFIADTLGGHVFEREGRARLPIKKLFGPSLGSALVQPAVDTALRVVINERWPVVYEREINFAIQQEARRRGG